jgi:hypothetical protein
MSDDASSALGRQALVDGVEVILQTCIEEHMYTLSV